MTEGQKRANLCRHPLWMALKGIGVSMIIVSKPFLKGICKFEKFTVEFYLKFFSSLS